MSRLSTIEEADEDIEFDEATKINVNDSYDSYNTSNKYYQENDQGNNLEQKNENTKKVDSSQKYNYRQFRIFACIAIMCMFFKLRRIK
jgi:hypothetical protein